MNTGNSGDGVWLDAHLRRRLFSFKGADPALPDWEAAGGELAVGHVSHAGYDETAFTSHFQGGCDDQTLAAEYETVVWPRHRPPRIAFAPVRTAVAGYSALPTDYPAANITVDMGDAALARELAECVYGGPGAGLMEEKAGTALGRHIADLMAGLEEKAVRSGAFIRPMTIITAVRTDDGTLCFPSAPVMLIPSETYPQLATCSAAVHDTTVTIGARLTSVACRLAYRVLDTGDLAQGLAGGARPEALEILISPAADGISPAKASPLRSLTGYVSTGWLDGDSLRDSGETRCSELEGMGNTGWYINDTERDARTAALLSPGPYFRAASISWADLMAAGPGWRAVNLSPQSLRLTRSDLGKSNGVWFHPDYGACRRMKAKSAAAAARCMILIRPETCLGPMPDVQVQNTCLPAANRSGVSLRLWQGFMEKGDLVFYECQTEESLETSVEMLHQAVEKDIPLHTVYTPDPDMRYLVMEETSGSDRRWASFAMRPLACGGSGWLCVAKDQAAPHSGQSPFPEWKTEAFHPTSLSPGGRFGHPSEYSRLQPDTIAVSLPGNHEWYPSAARIKADNVVTAAVVLNRQVSGAADPVLIFGSGGTHLFGSKTMVSAAGNILRWEKIRHLSSLTLQSARHLVSTRFGVAFLSQSGLMLTAGNEPTRLSRRGREFSIEGAIVSHPAVSLLEYRPDGGGGSWWYDLETSSELTAGQTGAPIEDFECSDPVLTGLLENPPAGTRAVAGRPFSIDTCASPAIVRGIRILGGNPTGWIALQGSEDLRSWTTLGYLTATGEGTLSQDTKRWWRIAGVIDMQAGGMECVWTPA